MYLDIKVSKVEREFPSLETGPKAKKRLMRDWKYSSLSGKVKAAKS